MTGPRLKPPRLKRYQDLIDAVEAMQIGDPPFRYDVPEGEARSLYTAIARYCPNTWRHYHEGQLWVVKFA